MKIKLLLLFAALLAASTLGAQTIDIDATVERALEQADIENTVREAVERSMKLVSVEKQNDTVVVSAGRHRVVVVERNDDGSRTEVAYFKDGTERSSKGRYNHRRRRISSGIMIDMGFNIYDRRNIFTGEEGDDEFAPQHTSKSFGVALYPIMSRLRLNFAGTLNLNSGLGLDMANYRFEDNYTLINDGGFTRPTQFADYGTGNVMPLKKSKLQSTYLNVPLTLGVRIPTRFGSDGGIRLEAGVIGSLKLGAHTKWKYARGGKDKDHSSFNLSPVRYMLTARAGYGPLMAFFNYQMTPMFKHGHGAELYPYQVGLSWRLGSSN